MPMRQDCKYFESRSYPNGDTVRKCDLDLAPEAPWRCPDDCDSYTRRLADVNWSYGSLITPETPPEPESLGTDGSIGALLDKAEDIVNSAAPDIFADIEVERRKRRAGPKGRRRSKGKNAKGKGAKGKRATGGGGQGPSSGGGLGERFRRRYRDGG